MKLNKGHFFLIKENERSQLIKELSAEELVQNQGSDAENIDNKGQIVQHSVGIISWNNRNNLIVLRTKSVSRNPLNHRVRILFDSMSDLKKSISKGEINTSDPTILREVIQKVIRGDIKIHCECESYKYYRSYQLTQLDSAIVPEPRPPKRNDPKLIRSHLCHHLLAALRYLMRFEQHIIEYLMKNDDMLQPEQVKKAPTGEVEVGVESAIAKQLGDLIDTWANSIGQALDDMSISRKLSDGIKNILKKRRLRVEKFIKEDVDPYKLRATIDQFIQYVVDNFVPKGDRESVSKEMLDFIESTIGPQEEEEEELQPQEENQPEEEQEEDLLKPENFLRNRIDILNEGVNTTKEYLLKTVGEDRYEEIFRKVLSIDPTKQKKYSDWIARQYVNTMGEIGNLKTIIKQYDELNRRNLVPVEYRDINKLEDIEFLEDVVYQITSKDKKVRNTSAEEEQIMNKESKVIVNQPDFKVIMPLTHKAWCYWVPKLWCTSHNTPKGVEAFEMGENTGVKNWIIMDDSNKKDRYTRVAISMYGRKMPPPPSEEEFRQHLRTQQDRLRQQGHTEEEVLAHYQSYIFPRNLPYVQFEVTFKDNTGSMLFDTLDNVLKELQSHTNKKLEKSWFQSSLRENRIFRTDYNKRKK